MNKRKENSNAETTLKKFRRHSRSPGVKELLTRKERVKIKEANKHRRESFDKLPAFYRRESLGKRTDIPTIEAVKCKHAVGNMKEVRSQKDPVVKAKKRDSEFRSILGLVASDTASKESRLEAEGQDSQGTHDHGVVTENENQVNEVHADCGEEATASIKSENVPECSNADVEQKLSEKEEKWACDALYKDKSCIVLKEACEELQQAMKTNEILTNDPQVTTMETQRKRLLSMLNDDTRDRQLQMQSCAEVICSDVVRLPQGDEDIVTEADATEPRDSRPHVPENISIVTSCCTSSKDCRPECRRQDIQISLARMYDEKDFMSDSSYLNAASSRDSLQFGPRHGTCSGMETISGTELDVSAKCSVSATTASPYSTPKHLPSFSELLLSTSSSVLFHDRDEYCDESLREESAGEDDFLRARIQALSTLIDEPSSPPNFFGEPRPI